MDSTGGGGDGGKGSGGRFTHPVLTVVVMILLALGRRALSGWEPLEAVLDPTPDAQLLGDVVQTALWLAYRGLRKLRLLDLMDW